MANGNGVPLSQIAWRFIEGVVGLLIAVLAAQGVGMRSDLEAVKDKLAEQTGSVRVQYELGERDRKRLDEIAAKVDRLNESMAKVLAQTGNKE